MWSKSPNRVSNDALGCPGGWSLNALSGCLLGEAQGGGVLQECPSAASRLSAHGTSPELGQNVKNGDIESSKQTIAPYPYDIPLWCHTTRQMYVELLFLALNVKFPAVFIWEQSLNLSISDLSTVSCVLQIQPFREFCHQSVRTCLLWDIFLSSLVPVQSTSHNCSGICSAVLTDIVPDTGKILFHTEK